MTNGIRLTTFLGMAIVAAFVVFASARDGNAVGPPFGPSGVICFEKFDANDYHPDGAVREASECDGDASPGVATDTRVTFCVGYDPTCTTLTGSKDSNFGGVVGFIPLAAVIKPSAEMPVGALVGTLRADPVLGILGNACATALPTVGFTLMNASVDTGNLIYTKPIGQPNVMEPLARDTDGNKIPDGADKYPSFLVSRFDIDHDFGPDAIPNTSQDTAGQPASSDDVNGPAATLQPIARLFGISNIQTTWVTLNLMVFQPGIEILGPQRLPVKLNPNLGYPTVISLQDPTVPTATGAISDFCSPLNTRFVSFGLTRDNPCTGVDTDATRGNCPAEFNTVLAARGYPLLACETANNMDEDGDGKVNDGCPTTGAAPEEGPQCDDSEGNDTDESDVNDGCPAVGEPESSYTGTGCSGGNEGGCEARKNSPQAGSVQLPIYTASLRDADGDGIENPLDVCALKANPGWNPRAVDVVNDPDNDGLPNECDPSPNSDVPKGKPPGTSPNSPTGCEAGTVGPDYDQDCYANRLDNCPLTNQLKDPSAPASYHKPAVATDNVPELFDKDGDLIGDACDITACGPDSPAYSAADCALFGTSALGTDVKGEKSQDGDYTVDCVTFTITVQAGAPARQPAPAHDNNVGCVLAADSPNVPNDTGGGGGLGGGNTTNTAAQGGTCVGAACAGAAGIGSLAPVGGSVPAWAAILAAFGGVGIIGGLGLVGARFARRHE